MKYALDYNESAEEQAETTARLKSATEIYEILLTRLNKYIFCWFRTGITKLRPANHIRPTRSLYLAHHLNFFDKTRCHIAIILLTSPFSGHIRGSRRATRPEHLLLKRGLKMYKGLYKFKNNSFKALLLITLC